MFKPAIVDEYNLRKIMNLCDYVNQEPECMSVITAETKAFEVKWQLLQNRQVLPQTQGVYAVKTTGIFCRFGCRSRLPLKQNVVFFTGATAALKEGYRSCKKCGPLDG